MDGHDKKKGESAGSRCAHAALITGCMLGLSVFLCDCVQTVCVHRGDKKKKASELQS